MGQRGVKRFTTWEYRSKDGVSISIPVSAISNQTLPDDYGGEKKTYFRVQLGEPEVDEHDTDINRLRTTVFQKVAEQLTINWRPVLVVTVTACRSRLFDKKRKPDTLNTMASARGSLKLTWARWQVTEWNGQKMSRSFSNYHEPWGYAKEHGDKPREMWSNSHNEWPEVGATKSKSYGQGDPAVSAMIPDTPENRQALEAIGDQIEKLYDGLSKLLGSKQIEKTLAAVAANGLKMLAGPDCA